jgi:hypothetical protein
VRPAVCLFIFICWTAICQLLQFCFRCPRSLTVSPACLHSLQAYQYAPGGLGAALCTHTHSTPFHPWAWPLVITGPSRHTIRPGTLVLSPLGRMAEMTANSESSQRPPLTSQSRSHLTLQPPRPPKDCPCSAGTILDTHTAARTPCLSHIRDR